MTQEDPFSMVAYGIVVLLITKLLKVVYTDVTQLCYADNAGVLGTFNNVVLYFHELRYNSLDQGFYPKPTKIILIVHTDNLEAGKLFGARNGFKV